MQNLLFLSLEKAGKDLYNILSVVSRYKLPCEGGEFSLPETSQNREDNFVGRRYYHAIARGDLTSAEQFLSQMLKEHLEGMLSPRETTFIYLLSHLISAFDLSGYMNPKFNPQIGNIIRDELDKLDDPDAFYEKRDFAVIEAFVHRIMTRIRLTCGLEDSYRDEKTERICEYIQIHYSDPDLSVSGISEKFGTSVSYLSRAFKRSNGTKLIDYIQSVRTREAQVLLRETDDTIDSITRKVGYTDTSAFIRMFKKNSGMTPKAFREQFRK